MRVQVVTQHRTAQKSRPLEVPNKEGDPGLGRELLISPSHHQMSQTAQYKDDQTVKLTKLGVQWVDSVTIDTCLHICIYTYTYTSQ